VADDLTHSTSLTCPSWILDLSASPNLRLIMEKVVSTFDRAW
jgi:hypothetical protein